MNIHTCSIVYLCLPVCAAVQAAQYKLHSTSCTHTGVHVHCMCRSSKRARACTLYEFSSYFLTTQSLSQEHTCMYAYAHYTYFCMQLCVLSLCLMHLSLSLSLSRGGTIPKTRSPMYLPSTEAHVSHDTTC